MTPELVATPRRAQVRTIALEQLRAHPGNVRRDHGDLTELAASIVEHGILEPLVVMPAPADPHLYVVLAGHRRLAAARTLRLHEVPCIVRHVGESVNEQQTLMLVENLHRADLTAVEKCEAFAALRDRGWTVERIAHRCGLSEASVRRYLTLDELDDTTKERVRDGVVGVGDALAAVAETRRQPRRDGFHMPPRKKVAVDPPYFGRSHPLAAQVRCTHPQKLPGGVACGRCWETAICVRERARLASQGGDL